MTRSKQYKKQIEELNSGILLFQVFIAKKKLEQEFDDFLKESLHEWSEQGVIKWLERLK